MGWGPALWGGNCEGGKVPGHSEISSQVRTRGSLGTSEGNKGTGAQKANRENSPQSSLPNSTSQLRSGLHSCPLFRVGAGCSGFRSRTPGRAPALTAEKAGMIQLRESREKTGPLIESRSLQQGASNSLHWWITGTPFQKCHRWDEQQL